jgi:hypothetical protein
MILPQSDCSLMFSRPTARRCFLRNIRALLIRTVSDSARFLQPTLLPTGPQRSIRKGSETHGPWSTISSNPLLDAIFNFAATCIGVPCLITHYLHSGCHIELELSADTHASSMGLLDGLLGAIRGTNGRTPVRVLPRDRKSQ